MLESKFYTLKQVNTSDAQTCDPQLVCVCVKWGRFNDTAAAGVGYYWLVSRVTLNTLESRFSLTLGFTISGETVSLIW